MSHRIGKRLQLNYYFKALNNIFASVCIIYRDILYGYTLS